MGSFNRKIVESLDVLNKLLALIFVVMAGITFFGEMFDNFLPAVMSALGILIVGIVTCGYTAILINVNQNIEAMRDKINPTPKE
jgi:ABC-type uncharacterized transport system permease subunit